MNHKRHGGEARHPRGPRRPVHILVVDDRPESLLALTSILEGADRVVDQALSGREALRRLLKQDYALVLLDVDMPDMDGFETAQLIRQRPASTHTPIVFVTAQHDDALLARSYALGAVDYITIPVNPDVLRAKAAVFVELTRKSEENRRQAEQLRRAEERLRRQAEERLRRVDEWLRLTVESISDYAIFSLDTHGRIATWNAGAARLFGLEEREALGSECRVLFPPEARDIEPHWRIARKQGRTEVEAWFQRKAGRRFFGRGVVTAMRDGEGTIIGYSKVVQDVTTRKETEEALRRQAEQLREANRLKDEFLAVLSHELRTPLNAIIGWTHLLRRADLAPDLAQQALDTIARNGQMQLRLINDILDVSRFITGKVRLSLKPVDINPIVRAAVDTVAVAAQAKGIELAVIVDDEEPLIVNGDAERLQQVVWNLVANAVKFTPTGGHIQVQAERSDRSMRLEVRDDGMGIDSEFLPFVFDRFRQADSSTVRTHGGLGLGLAIVKHLAEAHGGTIEARSAGEGQGATFELRLPVLASAMPQGPPGRSVPARPQRGV